MRGLRFLLWGILFFGITISGYGQIPFQIFLQQGETLSGVANGSTVGIGADEVGVPITTTVIIIYRGIGVATIAQAPQLLGSPAFSVVSFPPLPVTLSPGQSLTFDVRFTPTSSNSVNIALNLPYSEAITSTTTPPVTQTSNGVILLGLTGGAPDISVTYFLPDQGNVIPLPTGSTLTFPQTALGATSSVTIGIANRGSAIGKVNSITVTGAAFQPIGLPFTPLSIDAGKELRFNIQYSPKQSETAPGSLRIVMDNRTIDIALSATSTGSRLVYTVLRNGTLIPVSPNGLISFLDTPVGETSNLTLQVRNASSVEATISSIVVSGTGFQISDAPATPRILAPDGAMVVTLAFSPAQAGNAQGRIQIGADSFDLSGVGIGNRFSYSYTAGTATVPVLVGGSVFFSPVQAGKSEETTFTVQNTSASPVTISSIGIPDALASFTLKALPALPVTINPNQSFKFTIAFSPLKLGFASATLRIDNQSFALSGSGTAPSVLPDIRLTGPSGVVPPLGQPTVSVTLAAAYPLALSGALTISIDSQGLIADPGVLFSTGGRRVTFTIPANTTRAIFENNSPQVGVQTGSVASSIVITPSISIPDGADLTPSSPPTLQFSVAPSPPVLFGIQIANQTATQIVFSITGATTTRSLTQLDFTFTAVPGTSLVSSKVSVNIASGAALWFNSSASQPFGGQFTVSLSFTLRSDRTNLTPVNDIQSVEVTAANDRGTSNSIALPLH